MAGEDTRPNDGSVSADGGVTEQRVQRNRVAPGNDGRVVDASDIPHAQADSPASAFDRVSARLVRFLSPERVPLSLLPDEWVDQQNDVPVDLFAAQAIVLASVVALGVGAVALATGAIIGIGPFWAVLAAGSLTVASGVAAGGIRFGAMLLETQGKEDEINTALPGAVAYMYSQAAANTNIYSIIGSIAHAEDAYGPVAREFQSVVRRCEYFGYELQRALTEQSEVTASDDLGRLMSDMVTFLDSGGNVTDFFDREMGRAFDALEDRQQQRIDYLDVLSTLYVPISTIPILGIIIIVALSSFRPIPAYSVVVFGYFVTPTLPVAFLLLTDLVQPNEAEDTALSVSETERALYSGPIHHGDAQSAHPAETAAPDAESSQRTQVGTFGGAHTAHSDKKVEPAAAIHPADQGFTDTPAADSLAASSPAFESVPSTERSRRVRAVLSDPVSYFGLNPTHTLVGSLPLTLVVMGVLYGLGILSSPSVEAMISAPLATTMSWVVVPLFIALTPLIIAHEYDIRRRESLFSQYPEMLQKVSAANETGMTLMESLREASGEGNTQIDREMQLVDQKVAMGVPVETALAEFANAYSDPQISRSTRLLIEAQRASERVSNVVEIAIDAALSRLRLRQSQKSATQSYVVMIALTTLVAIGAAAGLTRVLTSMLSGGIVGGSGSVGFAQSPSGIGDGLRPELIRVILYHVSMIYAAFGGLFAGYLGATEFESGLKYSLIGMLVATGIWWVALGGGGLL